MTDGTSNINDPEFGLLTWDQDSDCWEGVISLEDNKSVQLYILAENEDRLAPIRIVRTHIECVTSNWLTIRKKMEETVFEIAVNYWDVPAKKARSVIKRLKLESLHVVPGYDTDLFFDDGGLFGGHCISVNMEMDGTVTSVALEG